MQPEILEIFEYQGKTILIYLEEDKLEQDELRVNCARLWR